MSDLLDMAIAAHGGWEAWRRLRKLTAQLSIGGSMWQVKGWPDAFAQVEVSIDPHRQHTEFVPFLQPGRRGVYEPDATATVAGSGEIIERRERPRQAFEGHALATRWDSQNLLYFAGYALWTYLTTPFLFRLPGFRAVEVEPWDESGETWRRLKVTFPPEVASHSAEQVFYFDSSGLLRRHDYSVEIMGGTSSANYASRPKAFGGLIFPTKRRVHAIGPGNRPLLDRVAVAIDIHGLDLVEAEAPER